MLQFNLIEYKNFLATGAAGNSIKLDVSKTTLITGRNGSGKSTGPTDALCFGLFNKPFRNINRGQLVNSINQKDCLVTIHFTVNGKTYKVVRGIKPNVFEIWENGILFNKDAASRDYQKVLETQILKYNFKTFTQVVLLGSASFVPFMSLPKASRREVIEDVLDIGVFSTMNELLKKEYSLTKEQISVNSVDLKLLRERAEGQKRVIKLIVENTKSANKELQDKIDTLTEEINKTNNEIEIHNQEIEKLLSQVTEYDAIAEHSTKAKRLLVKKNSEIEILNKEMEFFCNNETCPTCSQNISHDHKETVSAELTTKKEKITSDVITLEDVIEKCATKIAKMDIIKSSISTLEQKKRDLSHIINFNTKSIKEKEETIRKNQVNNDLDAEKNALNVIVAEGIALREDNDKLLELERMQQEALLLLKDNGIKTSIINEYIPVINKLINQYLSEMDFFCNFNIDNEFNEVIKSRYRDDFSYESFSEGEKQKIDIAIMFTFRQIARMKNSLNCNLLVLDEIFSSSLEQAAVHFLVEMLNNLKDTNTFVITHHPTEFEDAFDRHITFQCINNFSVSTEETK